MAHVHMALVLKHYSTRVALEKLQKIVDMLPKCDPERLNVRLLSVDCLIAARGSREAIEMLADIAIEAESTCFAPRVKIRLADAYASLARESPPLDPLEDLLESLIRHHVRQSSLSISQMTAHTVGHSSLAPPTSDGTAVSDPTAIDNGVALGRSHGGTASETCQVSSNQRPESDTASTRSLRYTCDSDRSDTASLTTQAGISDHSEIYAGLTRVGLLEMSLLLRQEAVHSLNSLSADLHGMQGAGLDSEDDSNEVQVIVALGGLAHAYYNMGQVSEAVRVQKSVTRFYVSNYGEGNNTAMFQIRLLQKWKQQSDR